MTYTAVGAKFDGTCALTSNIVGSKFAASGKLIFSCWFRVDGPDNTDMLLFRVQLGDCSRFSVVRAASNKLRVVGATIANVYCLCIESTTSYLKDDAWVHLLFSWDSSNASHKFMYVNDVSVIGTKNYINTLNSTIDYGLTNGRSTIFVGANNTSGFGFWNGGIAELFFCPGQYLDMSVTGNRRKFTSVADNLGWNYPIDFGSVYASGPLSSASATVFCPLWLHCENDWTGNWNEQWRVNKGNGVSRFTTISLVGQPDPLKQMLTRPTAAGNAPNPDVTQTSSDGGDSGGDGADGDGQGEGATGDGGLGGGGDGGADVGSAAGDADD